MPAAQLPVHNATAEPLLYHFGGLTTYRLHSKRNFVTGGL